MNHLLSKKPIFNSINYAEKPKYYYYLKSYNYASSIGCSEAIIQLFNTQVDIGDQRMLVGQCLAVYVHVMSRSRSPKKQLDEKQFPIRLRVLVPEEGFGIVLNELHDWLRLRTSNNFAIHSDSLPGMDAMSIYLNDLAVLAELKSRFDLPFASTSRLHQGYAKDKSASKAGKQSDK